MRFRTSGRRSGGSVGGGCRRSGTSAWTSLPVSTLRSGHYRATFTAPESLTGLTMDLRVRVSDVKGGALTQTTYRAFLVGP